MSVGQLAESSVAAPLSRLVIKEYNALMSRFISLPKDKFFQETFLSERGKMSCAKLLAYQIGWGQLLISWYDNGIRGEVPEMPGEGFTKWDYKAIAEHFYKKFASLSFERQAELFAAVVSKIIDIIETEYKSGNLDKTGVWPWCTLASGKKWPLSKWIRVNTYAPYKRATSVLRKMMN